MRRAFDEEKGKVLILSLVGLLLSLSFAITLNQKYATQVRSDIYVRWYAMEKRLSEGRSLYDSQNGEEVIREVWGEEGYPGDLNFYYPAYLIVLIGPLALLPYPTAHLIWAVAIQGFFLVGTWLAMRVTKWPSSVNKQSVFIILAALSIPHLAHTVWGQFNTIGVLSLVLCLWALSRERYGLAGVWAVGLTFKPHVVALTLVFLLLWAAFRRERWRFYAGFTLTAGVMWAVAELVEPGWVPEFLKALGRYISTQSVVDWIWNPHQVVAAALCAGMVGLSVYWGRAAALSPAFAGCLALSVSVWFLVVPVFGMPHVVMLPVAAVLLLAGLNAEHPRLYRYTQCSLVLIYILGIAGFVGESSIPELYRLHTPWVEFIYKAVAPVVMTLLALPLCLKRKAKAAVLA